MPGVVSIARQKKHGGPCVMARALVIDMRNEETNLQITLVQWLRLRYPRLIFSSSAHAGIKMDIRSGALAKHLGYHRGWPDLFFAEPRGKYHGMFLELKTLDGRPSKEQTELLEEVDARGYRTIIAYGFDEAVKEVNDYMKLKPGYKSKNKDIVYRLHG